MKNSLNIAGKLLDLAEPKIMGIINLTPDSFYDGGNYNYDKKYLKKVEQHLKQGADLIDLGGQSTRPQAEMISEEEELKRVIPALRKITLEFPGILISIDTFRSRVAREAIQCGAGIVNDVTGGDFDAEMFQVVAQQQVPYVLMHSRGNSQNMQSLCTYDDIKIELVTYFQKRIAALRYLGIKDIILDLGFGFAKTLHQNYELLRNINYFKEMLQLPILAGLSRKSMLTKVLNISQFEALNGTTSLHTIALMQGASILRVHDVKEAVETVKLFRFYKN